MIGPGVSFPFVIQTFFFSISIYIFCFFSLWCLFRLSGIKDAKVGFNGVKLLIALSNLHTTRARIVLRLFLPVTKAHRLTRPNNNYHCKGGYHQKNWRQNRHHLKLFLNNHIKHVDSDLSVSSFCALTGLQASHGQ